MVLSWTKGRVFRRARKGKDLNLDVEISTPTHFRCPITLDMMKDPVTLSTGITYDRDSIDKWFQGGNNTCPVTKTILTTFDMIPNHALRKMIQDWCSEHHSFGIERIPTPRIPVTLYQVSDTCTRIMSFAQLGDVNKCLELVRRIKAWGKESERNKKCIMTSAASVVLAKVFDIFSSSSSSSCDGSIEISNVGSILEEILGVLAWMVPLSQQGKSILESLSSMNCIVWFLNGKDLSSRQSAALLLKEMNLEALEKTEGVIEGLVKMIKEPIGHAAATKACLSIIFNMVSSSKNREVIAQRFVELGLVSILLEELLDAERRICEKVLGVLDCICECKQGKEMAKSNALTLPLVIKKLLRVSDLSSSFAVSIVWKLCVKTEEKLLIEVLQVGVFQKLLVMLQVGCGDSTKEKATELLKLLNGYRSKAECVDSSSLDFKHLKKPF